MTDEVAKKGNAIMPLPNETAIGGHAILAVGYDEKRKVLIVRNSWGSEWGDKGYFY
jgi:C1A family cysteine protease